ncbi:MAG TPA: DegT/DnrJ/EryC1/StrS family aminotransferase, partial [Terriglobales bacterium]|nr:DegT/DnrJ/EryC1/StrS family aminotransferase [Terriglobales bacterium]
VHFIPVHLHAYFRTLLGTGDERFPGADLSFERLVSLPLYPGLRDDQVERVCAEIADIGASLR